MKIFYTCLVLCSMTFTLQAQPSLELERVQPLLDAEWSFIHMAKEKNTRDAFLYHLSDSAVTYGKSFQFGKSYLEKQTPNAESLLEWEPAFSDMCSSGDFGYNTGPWRFWAKRGDTKPVAFGEFVTVWRKQNDGAWKAAIDLGISHGIASPVPSTVSSATLRSKKIEAGSLHDFMQNEKLFIESIEQKGAAAYTSIISAEARMYRTGSLPFVTPSSVQELLRQTQPYTYTPVGASLAPSGDIGFVYGTANGEDGKQTAYLRIWKKEDGQHWKLVLEVVI